MEGWLLFEIAREMLDDKTLLDCIESCMSDDVLRDIADAANDDYDLGLEID